MSQSLLILTDKVQQLFYVSGCPDARLRYRLLADNAILLVDVQVADAYRGQGLAKALVLHALAYARQHRLTPCTGCHYIGDFLATSATNNC